MLEKIKQLSELPVFNGGTMEHALFTALLIVAIICLLILCVVIFRYFIKGINDIWAKHCETKQKALETSVRIEQERTKQTEITKRKAQY